MGNFTGYIMRLGKLRIINLYAVDSQIATTKQLASKDYPGFTYTVRVWMPKTSSTDFGTVIFEVNSNGVLSSDQTVFRGGVVMAYFAA